MRILCCMNDPPAHPPPHDDSLDALVRQVASHVRAAEGKPAVDALPDLRFAADLLTMLLDETMARAVLSGRASLRSAGQLAGLTPNAVGPRLARTRALGAYADPRGRVTASGIERARYDRESGTPRTPSDPATPLRFKPRRPT